MTKKTRTIVVTFEIEDNDLVEHELFNSLQCESFKDFRKLPDTKELYESDSKFRELCMKVKAAKRYRDEYINDKNFVSLQNK